MKKTIFFNTSNGEKFESTWNDIRIQGGLNKVLKNMLWDSETTYNLDAILETKKLEPFYKHHANTKGFSRPRLHSDPRTLIDYYNKII